MHGGLKTTCFTGLNQRSAAAKFFDDDIHLKLPYSLDHSEEEKSELPVAIKTTVFLSSPKTTQKPSAASRTPAFLQGYSV